MQGPLSLIRAFGLMIGCSGMVNADPERQRASIAATGGYSAESVIRASDRMCPLKALKLTEVGAGNRISATVKDSLRSGTVFGLAHLSLWSSAKAAMEYFTNGCPLSSLAQHSMGAVWKFFGRLKCDIGIVQALEDAPRIEFPVRWH